MIAAVAAAVQPDAPAGRVGEGSDHIWADGLIAGMVERGLGALDVGAGLFPNRFEAGDRLLQAGGRRDSATAGLDGVEERKRVKARRAENLIFHAFIEEERNSIAEEYEIGAGIGSRWKRSARPRSMHQCF